MKLETLAAKIALQAGPATITAPRGTYNMDNQKVGLLGPVAFRSTDGYQLDTHDVDLDMQTRTLASRNPVTGKMPLGDFSADRMTADLDNKVVVLNGHARLHITQQKATSPK